VKILKQKYSMRMIALLTVLAVFGSAFWSVRAAEPGFPILIERVDFVIENIEPSFWEGKTNANTPRLYYNFFIYIANLESTYKQIKKVVVYDGTNDFWTINHKEYNNFKAGYIGGYGRWYDTKLAPDGSLLALKGFRAVVTTTDGRETELKFAIPEPGATVASKRYLFGETFPGPFTDEYAPALRIGKISNVAAVEQQSVTIEFTLDDERIANARFYFYDSKKRYMGETAWVYNVQTKKTLSTLNNGQGLMVNGRNTVTFAWDDINMEHGKLTKTRYIVVDLKDGRQFSDTKDPVNFYYSSMSASFEVKL
jgi:hypothetical protein